MSATVQAGRPLKRILCQAATAAPPQARCAAEEQLEASRVHTQLLMKRVTEMERLRASVSA